jgi:hypothetical protein
MDRQREIGNMREKTFAFESDIVRGDQNLGNVPFDENHQRQIFDFG